MIDKLAYFPLRKRDNLKSLLMEYKDLFSNAHRHTNTAVHDVMLTNDRSIKQHPHCLNPRKLKILKGEIEYMLNLRIIESSQSKWPTMYPGG